MMRVCCALLRVLTQILPLILVSTDDCQRKVKEIHVKEGETAQLFMYGCDHWETNEGTHLNKHMSAAEQRQMGVVVNSNVLVILSASVKHHGNFSCNNSSKWISLKVHTSQSREYKEKTQFKTTCYTDESCTLYCCNIDAPNVTSNNVTWHKEGESSPPKGSYFSSVQKEDAGIYTCTRSYLYDGQIYNMTSTMKLDVQPSEKPKISVIISPKHDQVFDVDLGSTVVIDCKAFMYSEFDVLSWLIGNSFLNKNTSLPVFYNYTRSASDPSHVSDGGTEETKGTASLVLRKVSEDDLSKNYNCMLSGYETTIVTITLKQKARRSYTSLGVCIVSFVVVMVVTVAIYVKFKVDITLFLRDTLRYSSSTSDGKSYDAFFMCYKCNTPGGLNAHDARWLESVLEERFGYSLCLYDRDVLPGKAITEAVLDCIEQSRTVVLVPVSPDPDLESSLLTAIHKALVERQTRLVFITTETTAASRSDSFPEALQLLNEAGDCVTWKGKSSMPTSSSFWKQLRYYLPAPQQAAKVKLLPKTIQDVTS